MTKESVSEEKGIKITLKELWGIKESIDNLSKVRAFSGLITYKIAKLVKKVDEEVKPMDSARMAIYERLGIKNEKTGVITVPEEKQEELKEEIKNLFEQEININAEPVEITPEIGLSVQDYINLEGKFITVKE